ncbi:hypothetical protein E2542_SST26638 [Spatholobus suberectus]|nr:hypothetical protein E2542_SST26638 [Spatholobus suberectus]
MTIACALDNNITERAGRRGSVLQTKRRHDGKRGSGPQTHNIGSLKSTTNNPQIENIFVTSQQGANEDEEKHVKNW